MVTNGDNDIEINEFDTKINKNVSISVDKTFLIRLKFYDVENFIPDINQH